MTSASLLREDAPVSGDNVAEAKRISLRNVSKIYPMRSGSLRVFNNVNFDINYGDKVGILGRNGAGKSTLIRLISGAELPTTGVIERSMTVSWPLALAGGFQGTLTGVDNIRFICRIYGLDPEEKIAFVEEFSELGAYLRESLRSYSSGMRARLAFAISMVVDFDCFLIDEVIAVGDQRFREKCQRELFEHRVARAMLIVSHDPNFIRTHCDHALVVHKGEVLQFEDIDEAYAFYHEHIA